MITGPSPFPTPIASPYAVNIQTSNPLGERKEENLMQGVMVCLSRLQLWSLHRNGIKM